MHKLTGAHTPVEQLQGHGVSVVVRHQIDSLVAQTQVGHQGLHRTGLLKDGVPVGSLRRSDTGEKELCVRAEKNKGNMFIQITQNSHICYSLACH